MLIETLLKPTETTSRVVDVFGRRYEFSQRAGVPGRYIADVDDARAIEVLIACGGYVQFTDALPKPALRAASEPPQIVEAKAQETVVTSAELAAASMSAMNFGAAAPAGEANDAAAVLLSGMPKAVRKALDEGSVTPEVIRAALAIEKASTRPRVSVVDALKQALKQV